MAVMKYLWEICGIGLLMLAILSGCGSKKQDPADAPQNASEVNHDQKADEQPKESEPETAKAIPEKAKYELEAPKRLQISELKSVADRVGMEPLEDMVDVKEPDPEYPAIYNHNNGADEDDGSLWVEGKGYFSGNAEDFYKALTKPDMVGPIYLSKNITIDDMKTSDDGVTYVMHIEKGEGFEDAFDLGVTIDNIVDKDAKVIGWRYHGKKVGGSDNIVKDDLDILIYQFNPITCNIEYKNVFKSKSIHAEDGMINAERGLMDEWSKISRKFADDFEYKE